MSGNTVVPGARRRCPVTFRAGAPGYRGRVKEIERKFLLDELPAWLERHGSRRISQGYLAIGEEAEVRLRRIDGERFLTAKRGSGETREEVEIPLDPERFDRLWPLTEPRRIGKRRFLVPLDDGHRAEVDVYAGNLGGLVVAEVEFRSEEESHSFAPPAWFGPELTGDHRYANRELALHGRPDRPPRGAA